MNISSRLTLNNGTQMPYLGLGVFKSPPGRRTVQSVLEALRCGYRMIDTAAVYKNEQDVGQAIRQSGLPREEIFLITKLWNDEQGYDSTLRAFDQSLERLGLDYVDLYLIHWPVPAKRSQSWKALTQIYNEGRAKAIGVSNYLIRHLEELLQESDLVPAVNQVEFHPFLYQKDLLDYCRSKGIHLQSYSPLTKGRKLNDPLVVGMAEKYGKTPAQILIRWVLQHGLSVLPKSNRPERIRSNSEVFDFELKPADMDLLNLLDQNLRTSWDPTDVI